MLNHQAVTKLIQLMASATISVLAMNYLIGGHGHITVNLTLLACSLVTPLCYYLDTTKATKSMTKSTFDYLEYLRLTQAR